MDWVLNLGLATGLTGGVGTLLFTARLLERASAHERQRREQTLLKYQRTWEELGSSEGLREQRFGCEVTGWPSVHLAGQIDGFDVALRCRGWSSDWSRLQLRVALSSPLPPGTWVQRSDALDAHAPLPDGPGIRLPDPVLQGSVWASCREGHEELKERLTQAGVREALLAVVHQRPGSKVTEREIILHQLIQRADGDTPAVDATTVRGALKDAVTLAERLRPR